MATIYRRGRTWWGRVQRQGKELRQSLKTTARGVAEKRLKKWVDELDAIAYGERPRRTFDDMALRFEEDYLPTLKPSSAKRYQLSIDVLAETLEGLYLDEITSAKLSEFETWRRRRGVRLPDGQTAHKPTRPISSSSIRRDLACLSSMFTEAEDWGWFEGNPVPRYLRRRRKKGLKEGSPGRRYLTRDEEARLLAEAGGTLAIAVQLAIDTGLRREELFSLKWHQVDLARAIVSTTTDTKNGKPRDVPLLPRSAQILAHLPRHIRSPYVIHHPDGRRFVHLSRSFTGAMKRAGLKPAVWHDLRRTCGCRLLQDHGKAMSHVRDWLGHESIRTTEKSYAFLELEHLQQGQNAGTKTGTRSAQ